MRISWLMRARNLRRVRALRSIDEFKQFFHNLLKFLIALRQLLGAGSDLFFQSSVGVLQFFVPKVDKPVEVVDLQPFPLGQLPLAG